MSLDAEDLKARARGLTGLSDFGAAPLDDGLGAFVRSLNESEESGRGLAAAEAAISTALTNRLRVEDWIRRHPEVLGQEIIAPVFVLGLPRSGTTALAQFLSEDPDARSVRRWEAYDCVPPADPAVTDDPRLIALRQAYVARDRDMPEFRSMLPVDAEDPTEHSVLLGLTFRSMHLPLMHYAPAMERWLLGQDLTPAYAYLKRVLQLLQSKTPAPYWNLKFPLDLFGLDALLSVFPDARLVWSHRDPSKTVPSFCSLLHALRTANGVHSDKVELGRMGLRYLSEGMRRALAVRRTIGDDRFVDLMQSDLVGGAAGVVEHIYARIGQPFTDEFRTRLSKRVETRAASLAGRTHEYSLRDFGISQADIRESFSDYIERFHLPAAPP